MHHVTEFPTPHQDHIHSFEVGQPADCIFTNVIEMLSFFAIGVTLKNNAHIQRSTISPSLLRLHGLGAVL